MFLELDVTDLIWEIRVVVDHAGRSAQLAP